MSELNDKILEALKCLKTDSFEGDKGWVTTTSKSQAAKAIEILVLEGKFELLNSIHLEHFGEGGTIMVGESELGYEIEKTEERLNQLKKQ